MDPVTTFGLVGALLKAFAGSETLKSLSTKVLTQAGATSTRTKLKTAALWYRTERLVIVLGAGASSAYGLPTWNVLLQKLLLLTIKDGATSDTPATPTQSTLLARAFTTVFNPNPLVAARYLSNHFHAKAKDKAFAFETAIRDILYEEVKSASESSLIQEIRQYCIAPGRSPNIDSIVSYNYDDVLEQSLSQPGIDVPYLSVYAPGMHAKEHELAIYHVHGFLPRNGDLTSHNRVVLSEHGYHEQYLDMYGWANLVQINKYKDHNCIFVGLSFSDPNLRRLLDISRRERGNDLTHHLAFRKRHSRPEVKSTIEKMIVANEEAVRGLDPKDLSTESLSEGLCSLMEAIEEADAKSFGVDLLWVANFDEIPRLLNAIRTQHRSNE